MSIKVDAEGKKELRKIQSAGREADRGGRGGGSLAKEEMRIDSGCSCCSTPQRSFQPGGKEPRKKKEKKAPENPKESCKDRENPAGGIQNIPKDPDRISNTFKTWRYQEDP